MLFFSSCKDNPSEVAPPEKLVALKVLFKQYSAPNYLCWAPTWTPATMIKMPQTSLWDYASQKASGKAAYQINVQRIKSDGTSAFYANNDQVAINNNGQLSIPVPSTGKFQINLSYASACSTCMPNTGIGKTPGHELWDNRTEISTYTQTGTSITVNSSLVSSTSLHPCGMN